MLDFYGTRWLKDNILHFIEVRQQTMSTTFAFTTPLPDSNADTPFIYDF